MQNKIKFTESNKNIIFNNLVNFKVLILPIFLFCFIGTIYYFLRGGNIHLFTSDFDFYHSYAHDILGDNASILSNEIHEKALFNCEIMQNINPEGNCDISRISNNVEWNPGFFYSLVFLSPITILGSKINFFLLGLLIGISTNNF